MNPFLDYTKFTCSAGKKTLTVYLLILLSVLSAYSQKSSRDSLEKLLKSGLAGTKKVDVLNDLAYDYYDYNDTIGLRYANEALKEATAIKYAKGTKYAYTLIGIGSFSVGNYQQAEVNFRRSDKISAENADEIAFYNIMLLGNIKRDRALIDSALYYYSITRKYRKNVGGNWVASLHKNYANLYLRQWKNEQAIKHLDSAQSILNKIPMQYTQLELWSAYGRVYQNLLQHNKSQEYFDKVCSKAYELDDYFHQIRCELNNSTVNYSKGEYTKALQFALTALKITDKYSYPPQVVEALHHVGIAYLELSEYSLASRYLFDALGIAEKYNLNYEVAEICKELAWLYKDQKNYTLSLEYIDRAQKLYEGFDNKNGVAGCYNLRGLVYYLQKQYKQAIKEHELSLALRKEVKNFSGAAASLYNMSLVYGDLNLLERAIALQKESIEMEGGDTNYQSIAISFNGLAELLIRAKRFKEAEEYLEKSRQLGLKTNSKLLKRNTAVGFSNLYEARGLYKEALEYRKIYEALDDSIYSEAASGRMAEMEALYKLDKKNQEIALLNKEMALKSSELEIQQAKLRQQRLVVGFFVIVSITIGLIAFIIFYYYKKVKNLNFEVNERNEEIQAQSEELSEANQLLVNLNNKIQEKNEEIQAQTEELLEANKVISEVNRNLEEHIERRTQELRKAYKELDTFFYRASHDFRRPLTTFMGLAEVAKITVKDTNALELFYKVNDTALYLDKMLVKLQSISDLGGQELVYKEVFLKELIENVCHDYDEELKAGNIKITSSVQLENPFQSYPALLKIILSNLIENSIFFRSTKDPFVSIRAWEENDQVVIEVNDNGEGIDPEYHERIFEMYFRAHEKSKGNGLGLYIVSKAIERLGGFISFTSEKGRGTTFKLLFPFSLANHTLKL